MADPWAVKQTDPGPATTLEGWKAAPERGYKAPEGKGWLAKAVEPITSYPQVYSQMNQEARERMSEGIGEIGEGEQGSGGWKVVTGALEYATSPISAGLRTVVGKPLEENLGIPKEYSEFAAGLTIPGYGLTKTKTGQEAIDAARKAGQVLEKIASPETVDANARAAAASIRELGGQAARDTAQTEAKLEPAWKKINSMPSARTSSTSPAMSRADRDSSQGCRCAILCCRTSPTPCAPSSRSA